MADPTTDAPLLSLTPAEALPGMKRGRRPSRRSTLPPASNQARAAVAGADDGTTLRDRQILAMRVAQKSLEEIAKTFQVSAATVKRSLEASQRRAFQDHAIDKVLTDLLPKAFAAVAARLDEGDHELGLRIMESYGVIAAAGQVVQPLAPAGVGAVGPTATFEEYRRTVILTGQPGQTQEPAEPAPNVTVTATSAQGAPEPDDPFAHLRGPEPTVLAGEVTP